MNDRPLSLYLVSFRVGTSIWIVVLHGQDEEDVRLIIRQEWKRPSRVQIVQVKEEERWRFSDVEVGVIAIVGTSDE